MLGHKHLRAFKPDGKAAQISHLGDLVAQDMIAIRLTPSLRLAVLGAQPYFEGLGVPARPKELLEHECIRYRFHSSGRLAPWICRDESGDYEVQVSGNLIVNSLPAAVDAANRGEGLIYLQKDYVADDIARKKLLPVLDDFMPDIPGFFF